MSQISPSSTGLRIVQIKPDSCKSKPMVTNLLNWSCRPSSRRLTSRTRWARSSTSATSWSRTRWRVWKMENGWDLLIEPSIYLRARSLLLSGGTSPSQTQFAIKPTSSFGLMHSWLLRYKFMWKEQINSQFQAFEPIPSLVKKARMSF